MKYLKISDEVEITFWFLKKIVRFLLPLLFSKKRGCILQQMCHLASQGMFHLQGWNLDGEDLNHFTKKTVYFKSFYKLRFWDRMLNRSITYKILECSLTLCSYTTMNYSSVKPRLCKMQLHLVIVYINWSCPRHHRNIAVFSTRQPFVFFLIFLYLWITLKFNLTKTCGRALSPDLHLVVELESNTFCSW